MIFNFSNILVFILVGGGFVAFCLFLGRILRPQLATPEKELIYECGEVPLDHAWINYNLRYYLVAIIFIIFDVEIAFVYPVAVIFKNWIGDGKGLIAFIEIGLFIAILFVGLVYVWVKGDLRWFKRIVIGEEGKKPTPNEVTGIQSLGVK